MKYETYLQCCIQTALMVSLGLILMNLTTVLMKPEEGLKFVPTMCGFPSTTLTCGSTQIHPQGL